MNLANNLDTGTIPAPPFDRIEYTCWSSYHVFKFQELTTVWYLPIPKNFIKLTNCDLKIRDLKIALQLMQEKVSDQLHLLLRKDILRIPTSHHDSSSMGPSTTSSSSKSLTVSMISPILDPPAPMESTLEEDDHTIDAFGSRYSRNLLSVFI